MVCCCIFHVTQNYCSWWRLPSSFTSQIVGKLLPSNSLLIHFQVKNNFGASQMFILDRIYIFHWLTINPEKLGQKWQQRYRTLKTYIGKPKNMWAQLDECTVTICFFILQLMPNASYISADIHVYILCHFWSWHPKILYCKEKVVMSSHK